MPNNQPERSVEEIASGILICICSDRGDKELCKNCGKPTVKAQVKKILTQERKKREEMVEIIETIRQLATDIYESGRAVEEDDWVDDLLKHIYKLTQPNNTK